MSKWEGNENVKLLVCADGYTHAEIVIIRLPFKTILIAECWNTKNVKCAGFLTPRGMLKKSKKKIEDRYLRELKDWCEHVLKMNNVRFRNGKA